MNLFMEVAKEKLLCSVRLKNLKNILKNLKNIHQKIHICGKRNSYSKTDNDATFMRMKEDAMKNGQLKACI